MIGKGPLIQISGNAFPLLKSAIPEEDFLIRISFINVLFDNLYG